MKKIHLISLGCAKNLVDSERFLASAGLNGHYAATTAPEEADLIVVNTCAFLQSAVEEALAALMEAGRAKKPGAVLAAVGCLPARYQNSSDGQALAEGLPEVDCWLAPGEYHRFEELWAKQGAARPAFQPDGLPVGSRIQATPFYRAFLKIAEGCDNRCTYCLIPKLRGPLKSYPADMLVAEAAEMANVGVRELTLVAQDLTAFGRDLREPESLTSLVHRLSKLRGLDWIRLLYAYPERLTEKLVKDLASIEQVTPYLDIPFQHAAPAILKRMGRRAAPPLQLVENLRRWWPGLALRTTLIVGFPGETEEYFEQLLEFVNEAAFDHLGVFKFSPEPEALAGGYADQVPQALKEKRRRKIMAAQRKISKTRNKARLGQTVPVLVEGPADDNPLVVAGRAAFQAPEVDGLIYFDGEQPQAGEIVETLLVQAADYDLVGRIVR